MPSTEEMRAACDGILEQEFIAVTRRMSELAPNGKSPRQIEQVREYLLLARRWFALVEMLRLTPLHDDIKRDPKIRDN